MKKCAVVAILVVMVVVASATTTSTLFAQANDPASVYTSFVSALNGHKPDNAIALFANNGVVIFGSELYDGRNEIMTWLQAQAAQNVHDDPGTPQVSDNSLIVTDSITTNYTTTLGVAPLRYTVQAVVSGGKFTSYVARVT